jgi:hypothetical protein
MNKNYYYSSDANAGFSGGICLRTDGDIYFLGGLQYVSVNPTMIYTADSTYSEKVNFQYLQVPLMLGFHLVKSEDLKKAFHVQLGGSFTSLLNVSENNIGIDQDNLRKTGFTFKAGVGADLWIFVADINYNLLLSHVYEDAGYNNKAKMLCWEFSLGVKIDLTKKPKHDKDDDQ